MGGSVAPKFALYDLMINELLNRTTNEKESRARKIEKQIEVLEVRLEKLQDRYLDDQVAPDDYNQISNRYKIELIELKDELKEFQSMNSTQTKWLKDGISLLRQLPDFYAKSSLEGKRELLSSIFPKNFTFDGKKCRTPRINEVLRLLLLIDRGDRKMKKGQLF